MSNTPVTVLMPVRNAEAHIAAALASMLNQTEGGFVLLLIDDGSTDASIAIAEQMGDPRVRIVRDGKALGLAARLNWGLDHATTPFVARMDADDVAAPERLARQLSFMRMRPDVGICGTWYRTISGEGGGDAGSMTLPTGHAALAAMTVFGSPFAHPTVMFNMQILNAAGLRYSPQATHAEDYDLWERSASLVRFANIPEFLLDYRVHAAQVSERFRAQQTEASNAVRERALAGRGIRPSARQLAIHGAYCDGNIRTIDQRYRALFWLRWLTRNLLLSPEPDDALIAECRRREEQVRTGIGNWWKRRLRIRSATLRKALGRPAR